MRHLVALNYVDAVVRAGSIRKAAETLNITSTALNRRILAMEEDLGVPIFERLPRGVRLSAAGEILIHHIRAQLTDIERVKSQIADLAGERRGHIAIACSQALLPYFLPEQISTYRGAHPAVTFSVFLRDRAAAEQALVDMSADLALVFEPLRLTEFQILLIVRQPVHAVMAAAHPLAGSQSLRLRDCLSFPIALPTTAYGVRHLLEKAVHRTSSKLRPVVESDSFEFLRHHALAENILLFWVFRGMVSGIVNGIILGLASGLIGAQNSGIVCIKHGVLRTLLWRAGVAPRDYAHFLDYATDRIFMQQVGGGYIFVHRLLLEHFASL